MNRFLVLRSQLLSKLTHEQEKKDLSQWNILRLNQKNLEKLDADKILKQKVENVQQTYQQEGKQQLQGVGDREDLQQVQEFKFPILKNQVYLAVMMGEQASNSKDQVLGFYIAYKARERACDRECLKFQKFIHFSDEWKEYQIRITVNGEFSECIALEQLIQEKMLRKVRKMEFQPGDMMLIDLQIKSIIEKYFENTTEINVNFEKFYHIKYQIEYKNSVRDELLFDYEFFE